MSDEDEPVVVPTGKTVHYGSLEVVELARQVGEVPSKDALEAAKEAGHINISEGNVNCFI